MKNETAYYTLSSQEVAQRLSIHTDKGLSSEEAAEGLEKWGPNTIREIHGPKPLLVLVKQFLNPMNYLLFAASGLSFLFEEWLDGTAILVVIAINAVIGFWMEWQAERSMRALKKMVAVTAKVLREGDVVEVSADLVVPGDILVVEGGDMITADARILELSQLQTNESALTGESLPVEKSLHPLDKDTPLAERKNMLYKGTFAINGNGRAVVVATGMHTELGDIARMVQSARQSATPLEKKLQVFSKKLILITIALTVVIFFAGLLNGNPWLEMLKTAIALAVAAIPEGLPIVATLSLAQGMMNMARHHVIVKRLASVETLGGTNTICTDKTGTLTQNKIEVSVLDLPGSSAEVKSIQNGHPLEFSQESGLEGNRNYEYLREIAVLCNTAEYTLSDEGERAIGDPLETGLLRFAMHSGMRIPEMRRQFPKTGELPFSSETKVMATMHRRNGTHWVAAKGAVEELLDHCSFIVSGDSEEALSTTLKQQWLERADRLAGQGLRVLAFAWKHSDGIEPMLENMVFTGIVGFIDPPAPGVQEAIAECREAGINVVMITGDHPSTALTIAKKLELTDEHDTRVMLGRNMPPYEQLSESDKDKWLETRVFARVSPAQKLDLIAVLQERKNIVGMTGDGVNDAPALRKADIGIAMGIRGTQVAQEAAAMVLKDDSFASVIRAIRQGRIIFDNVRKFVIYLLSCNMSELFVVAAVALMNLHFQLFPLQILFINLVTDVLPALALGAGLGNPLIMKQKPRNMNEAIITPRQWRSVWVYAAIISIFTIFSVLISHYVLHTSEPWNSGLCNNVLFLTLITAQLLHVFNVASAHMALHKNEVFTNKYVWYAIGICLSVVLLAFVLPALREILHLGPLSPRDLGVIFLCALGSLLTIRTLKKLNWIE